MCSIGTLRSLHVVNGSQNVIKLSMSCWSLCAVNSSCSSSNVMLLLSGVKSQMARVHMTDADDSWHRHRVVLVTKIMHASTRRTAGNYNFDDKTGTKMNGLKLHWHHFLPVYQVYAEIRNITVFQLQGVGVLGRSLNPLSSLERPPIALLK